MIGFCKVEVTIVYVIVGDSPLDVALRALSNFLETSLCSESRIFMSDRARPLANYVLKRDTS